MIPPASHLMIGKSINNASTSPQQAVFPAALRGTAEAYDNAVECMLA